MRKPRRGLSATATVTGDRRGERRSGLGATFSFSVLSLSLLVVMGCTPLVAPEVSDPATTTQGRPEPQEAALQRLRDASDHPTHVYFRNGFPRVVETHVQVAGTNSVERAKNFLQTHKGLYGQFTPDLFRQGRDRRNPLNIAQPLTQVDRTREFLRSYEILQGTSSSNPDLALAVRGTAGPDDQVVSFYQTYRDIPIYGGEIIVIVAGDRVYGSVGALLSDITLDPRPRIAPSDAENAARASLNLHGAPALAQTSLVVFDQSLLPSQTSVRSEPHLAWRAAFGGPDRRVAFVDAHGGQVLFSYSQTKSHTDNYDLDLENAFFTKAQDTNCWWDFAPGPNFQIGDEDELYAVAGSDPEAMGLWSFAKQAYVFYHDTFGIHSYDDDDAQYELYIRATNPGGAQWVPGSMDCDLVQFSAGFVGFDVLVHELGHAVMDYGLHGGPGNTNQAGALGESYADTMAALADGNWTLGEGRVGGGGAIRDMSNPPTLSSPPTPPFGDPDRMADFVNTSVDSGGVHKNSGIPSKAQFLLADGGTHPGTGWKVFGIGKPAMGWIAYMTMGTLTPTAGFVDARGLSILFATLAYSPDVVCQVRNAWAAVEVGNGDINCDGQEEDPDVDGDGVNVPLDNCPFTFNPSQLDTDGDSKGNACDGDADEDGVLDFAAGGGNLPDNCPGKYNPDQGDANHNGIGTACDPTEDDDFDNDGVKNAVDNCPLDFNPTQANVDKDKDDEGDACDPDSDGDGWSNDNDNAPFAYNPDQADSDGDGLGDISDACPGVADEGLAWSAGIPEFGIPPRPIQPDLDGNGVPDACDHGFKLSGNPPWDETALGPDGQPRRVDAEGSPGTYLRVPLSPCIERGGCPEWFRQDERRTLTLRGMDRRVKTWITDETGRTVGKPNVRTGDERVLRFRPLAGHDYYLFLYFSRGYGPTKLPERFSATMSVTTATVHIPPPPRTRVRPPTGEPKPGEGDASSRAPERGPAAEAPAHVRRDR